ncbi:TIGR00366 family protein [uncultured Marinobacter sp.]|jgi:short-chain fatty acids transporter|uniref:short-chain fatty acid transporter n=1 Tax=uncultured Marinobacter sp. TaxID=187379 RepID=UPI000C0A046F|nr:serine--pyruvate aminotransferase [Marinobacter sp.]MBI41949.1 serine--pyruvate aminotransferase [Oceanospirillales bacterium]|tara:strand:- start:6542 stop:7858 length:1317 start_codon:yes stop_codon:yes gene_type:complete
MEAITNLSVRMVQRYLPSAFVLAVILTAIVFVLGMTVSGQSPVAMAGYWGDGFSKLFKFGMQMVLVLLTGYVLALTPAVQSMLTGLTRHTSTPRQALVLTIVVSFVCYYLNWGFGMVAGAILAREMGRRVAVHFPLIVAAAYGGELVRGPSSSIPLVIATPDHFMEDAIGIVPVSETLYSGWNIALTITLLVLLVIFFLLQKQPERIVRLDDSGDDRPDTQADATAGHSPAERIENSRWPTLFLGLLAAAYLIAQVVNQGFSINLNTIILIFLALGLILHRNSVAYLKATEKAVTAARGIIVQFPLYAGIAGMMTNSGLVTQFSEAIIAIATPGSFPLLTFLSAGLVNFFIPSGGGQWAIQGPIMMEAAAALGADPAQTIMAFTWGDGWTNQIQPFWALPLLGVAGLSARDIMGYLLVWLLISGAAIAGTFMLLAAVG